jgi:hypothetical protein
MRKIIFIIAFVFLAALNSYSATAAPLPPPPIMHATSMVGPWVVGAVGLSVISVMVRAAVVGSHQHRDLTSAEAIDAVLLPFFWIILTQGTGDDLKSIMGPVKAIDRNKSGQMDRIPHLLHSTQPGTQPNLTIKRPN